MKIDNLKPMKEQFLNSSFQVSKYLTFSKDAISKTTFKIGKNLLNPAIAFDLTTTIAYVPLHGLHKDITSYF